MPFWQKKGLLCCFGPFFGNVWCPVVTLVTLKGSPPLPLSLSPTANLQIFLQAVLKSCRRLIHSFCKILQCWPAAEYYAAVLQWVTTQLSASAALHQLPPNFTLLACSGYYTAAAASAAASSTFCTAGLQRVFCAAVLQRVTTQLSTSAVLQLLLSAERRFTTTALCATTTAVCNTMAAKIAKLRRRPLCAAAVRS